MYIAKHNKLYTIISAGFEPNLLDLEPHALDTMPSRLLKSHSIEFAPTEFAPLTPYIVSILSSSSVTFSGLKNEKKTCSV